MPTNRKSLSNAEKSLILVCLFAVLPTAFIVYLYGGRDAEPKWDISPPVPRPIPNGYDSYVAAAKATARFTPEVDPASDTSSSRLDPTYALKNYSLARRQQWLKANTTTFSLVSKGLATPSMAPSYDSRARGDWSALRQLARDMSVRSRTFQMQNQPMRATMAALDTMQMGQDTTRGGDLIARLVGIAIGAMGRAPLDDWNKTVNLLSANEARTATRRLESLLAKDQSATQTMMLEKQNNLIELRRIFAIPTWRRVLLPLGSGQSRPSLSQVWQSQTISKQSIYNNMVRALNSKIAASKLPYSQGQRASLPSDIDLFTQYLVVAGNRTLENEARHTTSNNMLLLRLALRAYIAEHGTAPATLSSLVPSYLKSIPTDVYNDEKPLFYMPQGKTYKLWSVGPDMANNGGVPFARKRGDKGLAPVQNILVNKGDFVAGLCR